MNTIRTNFVSDLISSSDIFVCKEIVSISVTGLNNGALSLYVVYIDDDNIKDTKAFMVTSFNVN